MGDATAESVLDRGVPLPPLGDWVSLRGGIDDRGTVRRVAVSRAADVAPAAAFPTAPTAIRTLNRQALGRWVAIQGQVYDLRPFDAGMRVIVQDASEAALAVVLPDPLWYALPFSQTLVIGDPFWAQGELGEQGSQLELLPELPEDVGVELPSP